MIHKKIYAFCMISLLALCMTTYAKEEPVTASYNEQPIWETYHSTWSFLVPLGGVVIRLLRGGSLAQIGNAAIYGAGLFAILRNSLPFLKEEYVYRLMKGKEWVDKNYPSRSMGYMGFMAGTTIGLVEGGLSALFTHYCLPWFRHENMVFPIIVGTFSLLGLGMGELVNILNQCFPKEKKQTDH